MASCRCFPVRLHEQQVRCAKQAAFFSAQVPAKERIAAGAIQRRLGGLSATTPEAAAVSDDVKLLLMLYEPRRRRAPLTSG